MGWWQETETAVWGDSAADVMDAMIEEMRAVFHREVGRDVTKLELRRGLEFSMAMPGMLKDEPDA